MPAVSHPFDAICSFASAYQLFPANHNALVAFSGGPDSVFLVRFLQERYPEIQLHLVHFLHGLRSDSENDRAFVESAGREWDLPVVVQEIPVSRYAKEKHLSLESAGRRLRLTALQEISQQKGIESVYLGHHADDACETMLFRLIRGTRSGMIGIRPRQAYGTLELLRPLLHTPKSQILSYLHAAQIPFLTDFSNDQLHFTRNKIRHQILPICDSINPLYREKMWDFSQYMADLHVFILQYLEADLARVRTGRNVFKIPIEILQKLPPVLAQILIETLARRLVPDSDKLTSVHIMDVLSHLSSQKEIRLPFPQPFTVILNSKWLILSLDDLKPAPFSYSISQFPIRIAIPNATHSFAFKLISKADPSAFKQKDRFYVAFNPQRDTLQFRSWQKGDAMLPWGHGTFKKVSRLFIDAKIERHQRDWIPIILINQEIAAVPMPGIGISDAFKVTSATRSVLEITRVPR